ncbi:MAG: hypothetical protein LAP40_19870 [Acidobacteriia bacterium]|nr:hypothetical protein [Terriglobia bacterium]
MRNRFGLAFGIGLAAIAIAVAGIYYMQRGAHVELTGRFLKVRLAPLDEHSSVAVVDFRFTNPSDYAFVVRSVTVVLEDASDASADGSSVSETDTARLFEGVPLLGQKYNQTLIALDKIAPHASEDRMIASRFEFPESMLEKRKRFTIRIDEVDGGVSEIREK